VSIEINTQNTQIIIPIRCLQYRGQKSQNKITIFYSALFYAHFVEKTTLFKFSSSLLSLPLSFFLFNFLEDSIIIFPKLIYTRIFSSLPSPNSLSIRNPHLLILSSRFKALKWTMTRKCIMTDEASLMLSASSYFDCASIQFIMFIFKDKFSNLKL
jgi:hypothetical protein